MFWPRVFFEMSKEKSEYSSDPTFDLIDPWMVLHPPGALNRTVQQTPLQEPDRQWSGVGLRWSEDVKEEEELPRPHDRRQQVRGRRRSALRHQ